MFNRQKSNSAESATTISSPTGEFQTESVKRSNMVGGLGESLASQLKPAVISEEFTIKGDIESEGTLHVEGTIIGTVRAATVNISKTGCVKGDVKCQNLTVKGQVEGDIVCDELNLSETAQVSGTLHYKFISVGRGARIACEMTIG